MPVNRKTPSVAALGVAGGIVIVSLVSLVVLPLAMNERVARDRSAAEDHADPARAALLEIDHHLSLQITALTRAAAARDPALVSVYRAAIVPQRAAMQSLARHRGSLGAEFDAALAELQRRLDRWHSSVQQSVDSPRLLTGGDYPQVVDGVHKVSEAITHFQIHHRENAMRAMQIQGRVAVGLGLLAAIAGAIVLWMIARLRTLAKAVIEESRALQEALAREQDLVRMRDEILGVVSHDLRSPLTTITLSTQLIPSAPAQEQAEHVETIMSTTRRMERLIQDLLDVTKLDKKDLSIRCQPLDPAALSREVIAGHEPMAAAKQIHLDLSVSTAAEEIYADRDRLMQALGNLLGNALKFTPSGGRVGLSVEPRDEKLRFQVMDTGPGIAPGDLPHIFEPFWQAKKTAHMGAGLGLKITRAIIEAHGGSIEVANNPEGGACFAFELPVREP